MKISVIMLAAGNSRRFGTNKLLCLVDGEPLYRRSLQKLRKAGKIIEEELGCIEMSFTVVTQYEEIARDLLDEAVNVLYNPHPEEGISSSIKIGLNANDHADACLFCVSDQPHLRAETVAELIRRFVFSGQGMAYVSYNGRSGNPSVFSKKYFGELLALTGDVGGKRVITAHREDALAVEIPDGLELDDMDTREQYEELITRK